MLAGRLALPRPAARRRASGSATGRPPRAAARATGPATTRRAATRRASRRTGAAPAATGPAGPAPQPRRHPGGRRRKRREHPRRTHHARYGPGLDTVRTQGYGYLHSVELATALSHHLGDGDDRAREK
ncbi:hypothetical protein ACH4TX_36020 [Streptomyces sp. NPDC021098]|uniref:hypothetical protein n=1 Tax=unclassified Streptomyces TaxID=2593676 RepID=UPI00379BA524